MAVELTDLEVLHKNFEKVLGNEIPESKFKTLLAMISAMETAGMYFKEPPSES